MREGGESGSNSPPPPPPPRTFVDQCVVTPNTTYLAADSPLLRGRKTLDEQRALNVAKDSDSPPSMYPATESGGDRCDARPCAASAKHWSVGCGMGSWLTHAWIDMVVGAAAVPMDDTYTRRLCHLTRGPTSRRVHTYYYIAATIYTEPASCTANTCPHKRQRRE